MITCHATLKIQDTKQGYDSIFDNISVYLFVQLHHHMNRMHAKRPIRPLCILFASATFSESVHLRTAPMHSCRQIDRRYFNRHLLASPPSSSQTTQRTTELEIMSRTSSTKTKNSSSQTVKSASSSRPATAKNPRLRVHNAPIDPSRLPSISLTPSSKSRSSHKTNRPSRARWRTKYQRNHNENATPLSFPHTQGANG